MPESDVTKMKVADLKRELKLRGLTVTGNKTELQDRLQAALLDGDLALEDTALPGDDLLDEDGVLTDEEEDEAKILAGDEEHDDLLKSPLNITPESVTDKSLTGTGTGAEDDILSTPPSSTTPKKIVLKRQTSASKNATTNTSKENTEPSPAKTLKMSERNPITIGEPKSSDAAADAAAAKKLTELSAQERLEMRAKKFGISANTADTAAAGTAAKPATAPAAKKTNEPIVIEKTPAVPDEKQIELLKKRAERFGCVVSSKMVKLDIEERLEKRKQRFGGETAGSNTSTGGGGAAAAAAPNSDEWSEKARKRLERFGNAANSTATTPTTITTTTTAITTAPKHPTIVAPNGVAASK